MGTYVLAVRAYSEVLYNLWGPRESDVPGSWHEEIHFSLKSVFMVDVRFELTTNDPWSVDDAICEGISPLGYWQKVNRSPTQPKPYNTLPPLLNSGILGLGMGPYVPTPEFFYNLWGPRESDLSYIYQILVVLCKLWRIEPLNSERDGQRRLNNWTTHAEGIRTAPLLVSRRSGSKTLPSYNTSKYIIYNIISSICSHM